MRSKLYLAPASLAISIIHLCTSCSSDNRVVNQQYMFLPLNSRSKTFSLRLTDFFLSLLVGHDKSSSDIPVFNKSLVYKGVSNAAASCTSSCSWSYQVSGLQHQYHDLGFSLKNFFCQLLTHSHSCLVNRESHLRVESGPAR